MTDKNEMETLDALRTCAASWEPDARLVGNVRANDIVQALDTLRAQLATAQAAQASDPIDPVSLREELSQYRHDAAHILIETIGAPGPGTLEETCKRAAARIRELEARLSLLEAERVVLKFYEHAYNQSCHEHVENREAETCEQCSIGRASERDLMDKLSELRGLALKKTNDD